jgi:hypothetical protein
MYIHNQHPERRIAQVAFSSTAIQIIFVTGNSVPVATDAFGSFHPENFFVKHYYTKNAERNMSFANLPDLDG